MYFRISFKKNYFERNSIKSIRAFKTKSKNETKRLRIKKEIEVLKYNQYNSFEKYAHQINQDLLCNEIDKLKAQRNALQQYIINLRRNFSEPSEN